MSVNLLAHGVGVAGAGLPDSATTAAIDTTGATFLVVVVSSQNGGTDVITDSKSNSWTALATATDSVGGHSGCTIWYSYPTSVGTSHTFTTTRTSSFPAIAALAFNGIQIKNAFDVQNGNSGNGNITTGSITPTSYGELLITGISGQTTTSTYAVDSSFSISDQSKDIGGNNFSIGAAWQVQAAAAAINPTWSGTSLIASAAAIAAFKITQDPIPPTSRPVAELISYGGLERARLIPGARVDIHTAAIAQRTDPIPPTALPELRAYKRLELARLIPGAMGWIHPVIQTDVFARDLDAHATEIAQFISLQRNRFQLPVTPRLEGAPSVRTDPVPIPPSPELSWYGRLEAARLIPGAILPVQGATILRTDPIPRPPEPELIAYAQLQQGRFITTVIPRFGGAEMSQTFPVPVPPGPEFAWYRLLEKVRLIPGAILPLQGAIVAQTVPIPGVPQPELSWYRLDYARSIQGAIAQTTITTIQTVPIPETARPELSRYALLDYARRIPGVIVQVQQGALSQQTTPIKPTDLDYHATEIQLCAALQVPRYQLPLPWIDGPFTPPVPPPVVPGLHPSMFRPVTITTTPSIVRGVSITLSPSIFKPE